jgi:hypothetical protein
MANLTTIAITNAQPRGCTLTLSGAAVDLNPTTLGQLAQVINKALMTCAVTSTPGENSATVTLPTGWS